MSRRLDDRGRTGLGVNHETLRGWVNVAKRGEESATRGRDDELSPGERDELRRLRRKVAELEPEKDILCKAAAYFAKRWVDVRPLPVHL